MPLSATPVLNAVDTQVAHLRHQIAMTLAEKENMLAQMKEARRGGQRAEAALRAEIETVKRASEKAGALDMRSKQKALALQEQVKQAWSGGEAADAEAINIERAFPSLETRLQTLMIEVDSAKDSWKIVREQEDDVREKDRKMRAEENKRLADVQAKLDKLRSKQDKKEAEKLDMEKRIEELERAREDAVRRHQQAHALSRPWDPEHRNLSAHPSLNNLAAGYAAGPAYRPRQAPGYTPRFPSAGARSPQLATSVPHNIYAVSPQTSQAVFRPKIRPPTVNAAAAPFQPSYLQDPVHHTTSLMPPTLQHRIFVPPVRPRPQPNFHPPPSVVEQQATRSSPTTLSPPSFPPLPGQLPSPTANSKAPAGPTLASIVTRAVLSPNSLLQTSVQSPNSRQTQPGAPISPISSTSPHQRHRSPSPGFSVAELSSSTSPKVSNIPLGSQKVTFAPPPDRNFPSLSPAGPWTAFGSDLQGSSALSLGSAPQLALSNPARRAHSPVHFGELGMAGQVGAVGQQRRQGSGSSGTGP